MTREEAFKTVKENFCAMCAYGSQNMESCDIRGCDNRDAIQALESSQGWIPVSERLPEEPGEYLITWTGILGEHSTKRSKPLMAIAEYEIYEPENYEDWITTGDEFEYYRDIKVSAWMPLPESYKPQESEG